jgi:nicotinate-nucleotide adenylyltransferase
LDGNVPAKHRLAMVKLAIRGDKRFAVTDLEIRRGGKSYSVDTVVELQRRQPRAEFHFIIGADSLRELHLWKDAARLVKLCRFIAVTRPGFTARPSPRLRQVRYQLVQAHPCAIASRDIRARVARGQSIRYLVPETVRKYVEEHQLYR